MKQKTQKLVVSVLAGLLAAVMVLSLILSILPVRAAAAKSSSEIQEQINACIQALDRIKLANRPANPGVTPFNYDKSESAPKVDNTEAMANEIAMNLEALVGTAEEPAPKMEPQHPVSDTTSKFANLQFGRNYDPNNR